MKAKDLTKQQQIDLLVLFATFKSFEEQLYNLKGVHSQEVKMWFNRLMTTAKSYEQVLTKRVNFNNDDLEKVYDAITDIIYYLREGHQKEMEVNEKVQEE